MEGDAYKKILHMEVRLNTTFWGIPGGGEGHSNYNQYEAVRSVFDVLLRKKK